MQLVSVIVCTYNGSKYIEAQLNSIVNQTYQNQEIIVVDDLSISKNYSQTTSKH